MKNYKTLWAKVHCDWPDYSIHKPLESKAHTDNKSKEQYAEYVEAGHPDKQLQSKFIEVAGELGLDDPYVLINIQHPGQQMPIHTDLGSARRYHYMTQEERHSKLERVFLFLDNWQPGQVIQMQDDMISNWQRGDVMWFDWRNTPHGTANFGEVSRPLLLITGVRTPKWEQIHNSSTLTEINI